MRKSSGGGKKKQPDAIDEVEELLRAAEDDALLNLTVNSHIKSKSKSNFNFDSGSSHTNAIDPDLDRRFQALRSKPSKPDLKPKTGISADHEDVDNLFARFAALKTPSSSTVTDTANSSCEKQTKVVKDDYGGIIDDENEEDEVSKILNWAIDAARLDPSPSSDIEDDENDDSDDDDDDDDDPRVGCKNKVTKK